MKDLKTIINELEDLKDQIITHKHSGDQMTERYEYLESAETLVEGAIRDIEEAQTLSAGESTS